MGEEHWASFPLRLQSVSKSFTLRVPSLLPKRKLSPQTGTQSRRSLASLFPEVSSPLFAFSFFPPFNFVQTRTVAPAQLGKVHRFPSTCSHPSNHREVREKKHEEKKQIKRKATRKKKRKRKVEGKLASHARLHAYRTARRAQPVTYNGTPSPNAKQSAAATFPKVNRTAVEKVPGRGRGKGKRGEGEARGEEVTENLALLYPTASLLFAYVGSRPRLNYVTRGSPTRARRAFVPRRPKEYRL